MAEQAKIAEARIAELEEQVRTATERAVQAEKERDEGTTEFPPGLYPSSFVAVGPSLTQPSSVVETQWKWQDPFINPDNPTTVIGTSGQKNTPFHPSLANLTLENGKTQVHPESQYFPPPQGHSTQVTNLEPSRNQPPVTIQTQPQFHFEYPPTIGLSAIKTERLDINRLSLLEERLKVVEGIDPFDHMGPADMCMVPGIVMPRKYKIPNFEKYTGIECPKTHLKGYCNKMAEVIHNEPLLIHIFRESLAKHALTWYMSLDRTRIKTWRDLSDAFFKQYKFNMEVAPDRSDLQDLEKKTNESVKAYAQRWRELASRISPPLSDKELISIFANTFKVPYYTYLISNPSNNFSDMVLIAERVEQGIKSGRIIVPISEATLKNAPTSKEEVGFVSHQPNCRQPFATSPYQLPFFPPMPIASVAPQYHAPMPPCPSPPLQGPQMPNQLRPYNPPKNQNNHWNRKPLPPLPVPLGEIYENLLAAGQIVPTPIRPLQPPYPKWYDPTARCAYHAGAQGHTLENCSALRGKVNLLIQSGWISFEALAKGPNTTTNPFPNHE